MPAVDVEIWYTVFEEPTHMRVKKSFNRTVWVALTISPRVMFNVHGRPFKYRPFHRHRAQDEQNKLDDGMGPETAMREHAMDADLLAKLDERVHHPQQCQVGPGDCALPEQVYSENRREEGNDHSYENDCFEGSRIAKRKGPHEISFLQRATARPTLQHCYFSRFTHPYYCRFWLHHLCTRSAGCQSLRVESQP